MGTTIVKYNGILFDTVIKSDVRSTPIPNSAGTGIKAVVHELTIEALIVASELKEDPCDYDSDSIMDLIRKKLTESSKQLIYQNKGFGTFDVNIDGSMKDIKYGPKPKMLMFEPIAGNKAARIVWKVTTTLADQCGYAQQLGALMDFWCSSKVSINKKGYHTITRYGRFELMANKKSKLDNKISHHASKKFKTIVSKLLDNSETLQGYHLEQDYQFSPDDSECSFTLTYTEIESPNPYPNGVVDISCRHRMASKLLPGDPFQAQFKSWTNRLSCSVLMISNSNKLQAWEIFSTIVGDRIRQSVKPVSERIVRGKKVTKYRVPLILSITVEEDIFTDSATFDVEWVSFSKTINNAFKDAGMFKGVEGNYWLDWTGNIREKAQRPEGLNEVSDYGNTETIVSPCVGPQNKNAYNIREQQNYMQVPLFKVECPPPESSWIDFDIQTELKSSTGRAVHQTYRVPDEIKRKIAKSEPDDQFTIDPSYNESEGRNYTVQDFGSDKFELIVRGTATRLGRPTTPPRVLTVGGRDVLLNEMPDQIQTSVKPSDADCPMYVTTWELWYTVLGKPKGDLTIEFDGVNVEEGEKI